MQHCWIAPPKLHRKSRHEVRKSRAGVDASRCRGYSSELTNQLDWPFVAHSGCSDWQRIKAASRRNGIRSEQRIVLPGLLVVPFFRGDSRRSCKARSAQRTAENGFTTVMSKNARPFPEFIDTSPGFSLDVCIATAWFFFLKRARVSLERKNSDDPRLCVVPAKPSPAAALLPWR